MGPLQSVTSISPAREPYARSLITTIVKLMCVDAGAELGWRKNAPASPWGAQATARNSFANVRLSNIPAAASTPFEVACVYACLRMCACACVWKEGARPMAKFARSGHLTRKNNAISYL